MWKMCFIVSTVEFGFTALVEVNYFYIYFDIVQITSRYKLTMGIIAFAVLRYEGFF